MKPWTSRFAALCGAGVLAAAGVIAGAGTALAAPASHHQDQVLRVGCGSHAYSTIGAAVSAAASGDTVIVCHGTYKELVTVPAGKSLTIEGVGHPVVDAAGLSDPATGQYSAVLVQASHTTIEGLTVENAFGEGILVQGSLASPVSRVTIRDNRVTNNDQGNTDGNLQTTSPYAECNLAGPDVPGDCGEGIHLWTATDSAVIGNVVSHNSGGILLSDETGPTYGNLIAFNRTVDNVWDCGVVLGGHNPAAAPNGVPDPAAAGVYGNTVADNVSVGNGLSGNGSGVLMGTAVAGGAVYDNTIVGNYLSGNGLAGVTLHSHVAGQDLNGNVVTGNVIGTNNLHGDPLFTPADTVTTGILIGSVGPLSITVRGNVIRDDTDGIWMTSTVALSAARNRFVHVGTRVFVVS